MDRRELGISIGWLVPMVGSGLIALFVPLGSVIWALAVAAAALAAANVALHLDRVSPRSGPP